MTIFDPAKKQASPQKAYQLANIRGLRLRLSELQAEDQQARKIRK